MPKQRYVRDVKRPIVVHDLQAIETDRLRRRIASLEAQKKSLGDLCSQLARMHENPKYR